MSQDVRRCPYCRQALPESRLGVRFPNGIKTRLFDLVQRGGIDGIPTGDLYAIAFNGSARVHTVKTLKAHIWQINDLIEDAGYRIVCSGGAYRLRNLNYDSDDDIRKSVAEGFRAIKARKAAGGAGWGE